MAVTTLNFMSVLISAKLCKRTTTPSIHVCVDIGQTAQHHRPLTVNKSQLENKFGCIHVLYF